MTISGGVNEVGSETIVIEDGAPVSLPVDKIIILYPSIRATTDAEICTLIHEMAHFLGGPDRSSTSIDDFAYGAPTTISHLTTTQRARNAETYSNFAVEAYFGREPSKALILKLIDSSQVT